MTKRRWLMLGGCFLAVIAIGSGWVVYSLSHLSIDVSPSQTEAMVTAFKGALGEAIFNPTGKPLGGASWRKELI